VSDHHHFGEYAEARHDHREYADDRHDHDTDYAEKYHRHHDLEREDESLKALLDQWQADLRELRSELEEALGRIRDLERLRPTCVICMDATATQQTVRGPACSDCVGEPPEPETDHHPYAQGQDPDPEPEEYDPGPEVDDEGGMSEYRYPMAEDYERGQS
jgi:hypothetical protein